MDKSRIREILAYLIVFAALLAYAGNELVGCGTLAATKQAGVAEIKRIYVRPAFRGLGLAKQLIARLEDHARAHGILLMRLETGVAQVEANGLYERLGYRLTGPFGAYHLDPHSRYYEKRL